MCVPPRSPLSHADSLSAERPPRARLLVDQGWHFGPRAQGAKSPLGERQAQGWLRGRPDANHAVVPQAGICQLVSRSAERCTPPMTPLRCSSAKEYVPLNIATLQEWLAMGRLDPAAPIDVGAIYQAKLAKGVQRWDGIKLLGDVNSGPARVDAPRSPPPSHPAGRPPPTPAPAHPPPEPVLEVGRARNPRRRRQPHRRVSEQAGTEAGGAPGKV